MKTQNYVLIGAAALAYYFYSKTNAAKLINYSIQSVALNFKGITPIMKLILNVQNVSNQSISIRSMTGNLYVDNTNIGTVSNFNDTLIAANAQSQYEITVSLNLIGVVSDIINLVTNRTGNAKTVQLVANANVEGIILPINAKYVIS